MGVSFRKRPGTKQLPYLSHEFIIQNHGDIATCLCMVFVVGLMFQVTLKFNSKLKRKVFIKIYSNQTTTPLASTFMVPKHNLTEMNATIPINTVIFSNGPKDLCMLLFYTIVAVIFHAIIQEYVLDVKLSFQRLFTKFLNYSKNSQTHFKKLMRKIRLSKTKASKFNESGQLLAFYLSSIICSFYIFRDV